MIDTAVDSILYCYAHWQLTYAELKFEKGIKFHRGLPLEHELEEMSDCLIVIDDLMNEAVKDTSLLNAFTEGSHHKNVSVVFLMQNIYHKGPHARTMSLNTQYMVLFKNSRDVQQVQTLARQIFGNDSNQFMKYYREQTSKPFGFAVLDLHPSTPINKRIVRNFEPKLVAEPIKTKSTAEQLFDLNLKINNPIADELLKAKKKYEEVLNDPEKSFSRYPNVEHEYFNMLNKFKETQQGKPSLPLKSFAAEKKSTDLLSSSSPPNPHDSGEGKKDLIDFHSPVKQPTSGDNSMALDTGELVKRYIPPNEKALDTLSWQRPYGMRGIPEDQISLSSDDHGLKVRPEDVALPPSESDLDSGEEDEESLEGENSEMLSLEDTKEERDAKYNYIERTTRPPSPIPDERIDEKDTDRSLFSYDDTKEEKQKKRNYIRKYNLRKRTPLNYPREWKGPPTIMDDDVESSDEERTRAMSL